jgi:hypothetical protein
MHNQLYIPLGQVKSEYWPFRPVAEYLENESNFKDIEKMFETWSEAKNAYASKNRDSSYFYLANASGGPPIIAKERDNWPAKESISDSKTSAGMDRTDDIKKGIYQSLKLGVSNYRNRNIETALISNLPALRHGSEYVDPFVNILWGEENSLIKDGDIEYLKKDDLRYIFDHLITLDSPIIR